MNKRIAVVILTFIVSFAVFAQQKRVVVGGQPGHERLAEAGFEAINKMFTKVVIAQLAEAGKVSLDEKVRKYLPDYPSPIADRITIDQLIQHRSGMGDFFGPRYDAAPPSSLRELSDFARLFADQPLEFEPGTSQHYSNAGYVVLGVIIERLTGQKYRDYVQQHVFAPTGMNDTGFWAIDEQVPNRAAGYTMHAPLPRREPRLPLSPSICGDI